MVCIGIFYVKIFEEEWELIVMLLIDMSFFFFFGIVNQFKNEIIMEICVVLVFFVINNNDKVGVVFFVNEVELFILFKKGKQYILCIIWEFINFEFKGKGMEIGVILEYFNNLVKKWSICFIIFDFLLMEYEQVLWVVVCCYDVIGVNIIDFWEENLLDVGLIWVQDVESGAICWIDIFF